MRIEPEHFGQIDGDLETPLFEVYFTASPTPAGTARMSLSGSTICKRRNWPTP
jgi:hypothetical protein